MSFFIFEVLAFSKLKIFSLNLVDHLVFLNFYYISWNLFIGRERSGQKGFSCIEFLLIYFATTFLARNCQAVKKFEQSIEFEVLPLFRHFLLTNRCLTNAFDHLQKLHSMKSCITYDIFRTSMNLFLLVYK